MDRKIILCFSGGVDSTLLALLLKEAGLPFDAVFFKPEPFYKEAYIDYCRARYTANQLSLELKEVEIPLVEAIKGGGEIARTIPFDRHFSLLHFYGMHQISEKYGNDIVVLNGQGADSILSFGPSSKSKGDLAARALIYKPFGLVARVAASLVNFKNHHNISAPSNETEFLRAFFDHYNYYTVLQNDSEQSNNEYIDRVIEPIAVKFVNQSSLLMYLKIYGFLQGSDNQVVLQAARSAGISNVVLPYVTPGFIYEYNPIQGQFS